MFDNSIDNITSESYDYIKYLLNSEIRLYVLEILKNSDCSVEDIKNKLDKQESNILRTLKELEDLGLVKSDDKVYSLTSSGYLLWRNIENFLDNWNYVNKLEKDWNEHTIDNIPLNFSRYLYLWEDAEIVRSDYIHYNKTIDVFRERIENSKNLRIVLPIYSKYHLEILLDVMVKNKCHLELVTSRNILNAIKKSDFGELFEKLRLDGFIRIWLSNNDYHRMFYVITDDVALLTLFYVDESYDDSAMLLDVDKSHVNVHVSLFDEYKSNFELL